MTTLGQFTALRAPDGQRLLAELRERPPTPATGIAVATRLRRSYPAELVAAAMELTDLRVRAGDKFGRADELWLTRAGLEQATSEAIAGWRARRFRDIERVADLCCGIGGDLIALAGRRPNGSGRHMGPDRHTDPGRHADPGRHMGLPLLAVDRDALHLAMAEANAAAFGLRDRIAFRRADVREVDLAGRDGVFIDPARRDGQDRFATGESEPPLAWCLALAERIPNVAVKAAPGIAHDRVPAGWEFETIALGADLKEVVLWSPAMARTTASATVIRDGGAHHLRPVSGDPVPIRVPEAGETLLDPNPAVTRAGLVQDLARTLGAARIDERIAFLVSDRVINAVSDPVRDMATPFARALPIVASLPWNERHLRTRLRELDAGPVDIRRRGLAGDVDAIARRLRGRGARPLTVAMTRVRDEPWAVVCEDPERLRRP